MKAISFWARLNPNSARFFIALIKIFLLILAAYTGILFSRLNILLSPLVIFTALLIALFIAMLYPKKQRDGRRNYFFQKLCDFFLAVCSFICFTAIANNLESSSLSVGSTYASISKSKPTAEQILASLKYRDKSSLTRMEKRILKKEFYQQLKVYAKNKLQKDDEKSKAALLIMLTIVAAVGLMYLLAALVCTLSCNGSDAAAVIVGILGLTAIIWGVVAIIKSINRKRKKKEKAAVIVPT